MARLWSCGFESQSVASGVEWDTTVGSPTINTTTVRSGAASLRCNPTAATAYVEHAMLAADSTVRMLMRAYVFVASLPSAKTTLISWGDASPFWFGIRLNPGGTLTVEAQDSSLISSASAALSTNTWYRIELDYDDVSNVGTAYVDGTQVAQLTGADLFGGHFARFGVQDSCTTDIYFDDLAVNDTGGGVQAGLPGTGKIVHLRPDSAGDNTGWATTVGGTANWQRTSETTPDDATTYNATTATGTTTTDDHNCGSSSSAGIGSADTVTLVQVGARIGSDATTAASIVTRVKSQASGTVSESPSTSVAVNGWSTHAITAPKIYALTSYTDPQAGGAWTPALLDTMQIGYRGNVSQTTTRRVSTLWALVEYIPTWVLADHIEAGFADGAAGHAVALPGAVAATAGQIDVVLVGSDATVSTPSGFTAGSTFVSNQGGYGFYRICTGGESATVTITTAVNANTNVHFSRWSGGQGFDVAANGHVDNSGGTTNPAVSTGTLASANDLVVTASVMTDAVSGNATTPVWSAGYTPLGAGSSGTSTSASVGFSAYKAGTGTTSESPSVTWTNSMRNRYIFALAFTPLSAGATPVQAVAPNAATVRASTW